MAPETKPKKKAAKKTVAKEVAAKNKKAVTKKVSASKVTAKPTIIAKRPADFGNLKGKDRIKFLMGDLVERFETNFDQLKISPVEVTYTPGTGLYADPPDMMYKGQIRAMPAQASITLIEEPTTRVIHVSSYHRPNGLEPSKFESGVYEFKSPRVVYAIKFYSGGEWTSLKNLVFVISALNSKGELIDNFFPHVYHRRSVCMSVYYLEFYRGLLEPESFWKGTLALLNSYWSEGFRYSVDVPNDRNGFAKVLGLKKNPSLMDIFVATLNKDVDYDKFPIVKANIFRAEAGIVFKFPMKPDFGKTYDQIASI